MASISRPVARGALVAALAASLAGSVVLAEDPAASPSADLDAAAAYCTQSGGQVQARSATWDTNDDPANWVDLGRTVDLCRFKADDGSRIYVDLLTLWSEQPSLAGSAYLAQAPMAPSEGGANPASLYCADLFGTSQFGPGAAGGGWVARDDPDDVVVAMCVFADGSMIDEWGLAYHSNGTIRGADLAPLMRSAQGDVAPIYGTNVS